jgi:hypothetical protein
MIDYVIRFFLTIVFVIFFGLFIEPLIAWIPEGMCESESGESYIGYAIIIGLIVLGWILSGKIIDSELYEYFLAEVLYTPNNAQMKFIMVPTVVICVTTFLYCKYYDPSNTEIADLGFGSLFYGAFCISFWFSGGFAGINSPDYNDQLKLKLSSLWAVLAPISVSLAIFSEQYTFAILQLCAMVAIRIIFFFRAVSRERSA